MSPRGKRSSLISAVVLFLSAVGWFLFVSVAWGDGEDIASIELFTGKKPDLVSVGRSPRPASQTAENITVVTSSEISALNAHTLADILDTVVGVQLTMLRTPGTVSGLEVQGAQWNHVLVLVDNVPINNLSDNVADISSIPAQIIERIEIVKGAGSSSWGSALGGVINVITKLPSESRISGEVSTSLGKSTTLDDRAELSGTVNSLGYYLSAGKLHSDGLLPNNHVDLNNIYGKLQYDLSGRGAVTFSGLYTDNSSGQLSFDTPRGLGTGDQTGKQFLGTLSAQYHPSDRLSFLGELKGRYQGFEMVQALNAIPVKDKKNTDNSWGVCLNASWRADNANRFSLGVDYDHLRARFTPVMYPLPSFDNTAERVGVYANDLLTLGRWAFTPSVRYDHTGTGEELFTPSMGLTYSLTDNTVFRGYYGRGYSLFSLANGAQGIPDTSQKVWTFQAGLETGDIPYLWLKGTVFQNNTWDIPEQSAPYQKRKQAKRGVEVEIRTLPLLHTSLSTGYTFIDSEDADSHQKVPGVSEHTVKLGLSYDDPRYLKATLTGSYIDWNPNPGDNSRVGAIFDLHLVKTFSMTESLQLELFLSVHNMFDSKQYGTELYRNTGRWAETGVRCRF